MGETANIAEIAALISRDIFKPFGWFAHPKRDDNFECVSSDHKSRGGKQKATHPGDVVFSYDDPYLGKRILLHTDLKSYAKDSISVVGVRKALKSLAMTVECARASEEWRQKYGAYEPHEVRGLLFVHNHDSNFIAGFNEIIGKVDPQTLALAPGVVLNYLGPRDITRLFTTTNDIQRLMAQDELPKAYTFYYPDLVMRRRQGAVWEQAATIESLNGPFLILKHKEAPNTPAGYVIYYNRPGKSVEEFEYFLDCLSRFQMLDSGERLRIRMTSEDAVSDVKSIFASAVSRYAKGWGFEPSREQVLSAIEIERVPYTMSNYSPGDIGWRHE